MALRHLSQHGHRKIAFIKGQEFSSDTEVRWNAIMDAANRLEIPVSPKLTAQLEGDASSPQLGYRVTKSILDSRERFTALFAFNDIAAIGAIRALREAQLRVPEDISVIGFEDTQSAPYLNPGLTTVKQPLGKMGKIAAETVLERIRRPGSNSIAESITVEPELVVREATGPAAEIPRRLGRMS